MRLEGKTAIIIGAGQNPGEGVGNGRATALRFAQEGAKILAVDMNLPSAEETVEMIKKEGGEATAFQADVTKSETLYAAIDEAMKLWNKIDIMHYNVGVSLAGGDSELLDFKEEVFDRMMSINLRGAVMACKHVIPIMRKQQSGVILMISSFAVIENNPLVAYKISKAGMNAFTKQLAKDNAEYGIRANVIMPGLMDTPMAVDTRVRVLGKSREEISAERGSRVPLRRKMGTAWDVANAALFLASDEAGHITGVELLVDGGRSLIVGQP